MHIDFELDDDLTNFWQKSQWHPSGDIEFFTHEYHTAKKPWNPFILTVRDEKRILSCVTGKIQPLPLKIQFGYKIFNGPTLTTLIIDRTGLIGHWEETVYQFVLERLHKLLTSRTIDVVLFRLVPLSSPLHRITSSMIPFFQRDHFPITQEQWVLNQVQSFDGFLKSRPHIKATFRKQARRLASSMADRVQIKCYSDSTGLEQMLFHSEEVSTKTWQRKFGDVSFLKPEIRSLYRFYFEKGWGRGFILYIDDTPVSFLHGMVYKDVFYAMKNGYDPAWRHLGVGTYLLIYVIRECCETGNIHQIDFSVGNPEHKRRYCDSSFEVSSIHLFGPTMRLMAFNGLRLMAQGSHQLAKDLLRRLGWYQSIRKCWRFGT